MHLNSDYIISQKILFLQETRLIEQDRSVMQTLHITNFKQNLLNDEQVDFNSFFFLGKIYFKNLPSLQFYSLKILYL